MLTTPVQRLDQLGRHAESAAIRLAPFAEQGLVSEGAPGLPDGMELPALFVGLIEAFAGRAKEAREEMVAGDLDLGQIRARLRQERSRRDVAFQALYDWTVDLRWRVKKLVGVQGERIHFARPALPRRLCAWRVAAI